MNSMTSPETLDKQWPPEIDWFDPYFNLSAVSQDIIDGLVLGNKFTISIANVSSPFYEWVAAVRINHDLADSYYTKHYMSTNKTMFICAPELGGRMDILLDYYTVEFLAYYYYKLLQAQRRLELRLKHVRWSAAESPYVRRGSHRHHWAAW